jgi:lysophospholipase L1-like esterase
VIDSACGTVNLNDPGNRAAEGYHPSDSGYSLMAAELVKAFLSTSWPAPVSTCSRMSTF